jgi:hypothetical protein
MARPLFILLATLFCAQVVAETRIDASTEDTFNGSLNSMKHELAPEKLAQLNKAVMTLPFAGMQSFKDTPPDGIVKLDIKKLDGMTADQIIELAQKTVSVKISVGPPPGLPARFKVPLRPVSDTTPTAAGVSSLAGTQWIVTENVNGHVSEQRMKLQQDGKVDDGSSTSGRWEQLGTAARISFNDNYAVYLGTLDNSNGMKGTAANINGTEWIWTAKRSDPR